MASWRIFLWVVVVATTLWFLWSVKAILLPFALAWLIAVLLEPVVKSLEKVKIPRPAAVMLITAVFFGSLVGVGYWVGPKIGRQANDVRTTVQDLSSRLAEESGEDNPFVRWNPAVLAKPPGPLGAIDDTLKSYRPTLEQFGLPTTRRAFTSQFIDPRRQEISVGLQSFVNGAVSFIGAAANQVILLGFTPLFVIFLMMDLASFRSRYANWIPPALRNHVVTMVSEIGDVFQSYIRGVTINIAAYTVVLAAILTAFGTPYSYLFALMAGALSLIPNIGGLLSMGSLVVVTGISGVKGNWFYTAPNAWVFAAIIAVVFTVISTIWDIVITPRVVGKAVKLHPFVGMFVVFCGGALFGLVGMMIAYPMAGVVKLVLERVLSFTNMPVKTSLGLPAVPLRHRGEPSI